MREQIMVSHVNTAQIRQARQGAARTVVKRLFLLFLSLRPLVLVHFITRISLFASFCYCRTLIFFFFKCFIHLLDHCVYRVQIKQINRCCVPLRTLHQSSCCTLSLHRCFPTEITYTHTHTHMRTRAHTCVYILTPCGWGW